MSIHLREHKNMDAEAEREREFAQRVTTLALECYPNSREITVTIKPGCVIVDRQRSWRVRPGDDVYACPQRDKDGARRGTTTPNGVVVGKVISNIEVMENE